MDTEYVLWLCYVKLLVCNSDKNSCQCALVYRLVPAKKYNNLVGFENEELKIIAIFKFHFMNRCAIAEIDEPEQVKASIKVLMVEDNLLNFEVWGWSMSKVNLVAYYGFDVETVMQLATNKQVDIIIVNSGYGGKYREVDWTKNILMLKSNPETTQIPIILKWGGQFTASDRERFSASGVNVFIQAVPGNRNSLIEKIQQTLSANNFHQNITINSKNEVSNDPPFKIQKEKESAVNLEHLAFRIYLVIACIGLSTYVLREFLQARINSSVNFIREFLQKYNPFKKKT